MAIVLDVKFASQVANQPAGIPSDWPVDAIEIDDAQPVTAGRTRFTIAALAAYKAARQAAYDSFKASFDASVASARAAERDAAEPYLATARDAATQAISDNNTYIAIASPTNAQVAAQVKALTQQNNRIIKALARLAVKAI